MRLGVLTFQGKLTAFLVHPRGGRMLDSSAVNRLSRVPIKSAGDQSLAGEGVRETGRNDLNYCAPPVSSKLPPSYR